MSKDKRTAAVTGEIRVAVRLTLLHCIYTTAQCKKTAEKTGIYTVGETVSCVVAKLHRWIDAAGVRLPYCVKFLQHAKTCFVSASMFVQLSVSVQ